MAGSIEKRGKNSYRLIVSEGYDLHGKPLIHRKTVHGTKKEAEVELEKFVTEVQSGLVIDGKALRFSEFVEIWKRDYGSKELAPTTYKRYCRMLETRILPYFGHFYINNEWTTLSAGNIVLYRPGIPQFYSYYANEKPEVYWIHFTGNQCEDILNTYDVKTCYIGERLYLKLQGVVRILITLRLKFFLMNMS